MKHKMILIKPGYQLFNITSPPLSLLTIASLTPKDKFDVEIMDGSVEKISIRKADIVGITVSTMEANKAYEIADKYKANGVKVIL